MTVARCCLQVPRRFSPSAMRAHVFRSTVVALSVCLLGCTTAPQSGGTDRITASDESAASKRANVRLELATAYFGRGQLTTALDEVKLAIQAEPNKAQAYGLRGLIYAALGEMAVAEESFQRALQINPRDADTMHNFGWFLCQQRRYPESTTYFVRALEQPQYTAPSRTLLARGVCEARAGQWPEAELTLKRAYDLEPSNQAIAVNFAQVLYQRGDFDRARFYVRRVNAVAEQANAQTLWLAARIEKKLGNTQGTQDFGQQLRERFPQSREASAFDRGQFDE